MNKDKSFIKGDAAYINYIKAFILEAAVTAVFIAIFSGVCCFASGGLKYAAVFATVSAAAGAFAAAWFLARKMGSKGWLIGLAAVSYTHLDVYKRQHTARRRCKQRYSAVV